MDRVREIMEHHKETGHMKQSDMQYIVIKMAEVVFQERPEVDNVVTDGDSKYPITKHIGRPRNDSK